LKPEAFDFEFLKKHGFGVVYGEKAVRRKIKELSDETRSINNTKEINY